MAKIIWLSLPSDVFSYLLSWSDVEDIWNLCLSCKEARDCIMQPVFCKGILQTHLCYSDEAQAALASGCGYVSAFRRVVKRRQAVATASPYIVAPIAFGDASLYCNGILSYTIDDKLRILDIHKSTGCEFVVSISKLLLTALPGLITVEESQLLSCYQPLHNLFRVLYSSHNIIACVFTLSEELAASIRAFDAGSPILESMAWLIAFDVDSAKVLAVKGSVFNNICFVRHNNNFLYYGTQEVGGLEKWVVHGYEFGKSEWFKPLYLGGIFGSEIGSQVCFEILGDHFLVLSSETSSETEEIDWTSFYTCFRFPLRSPCNKQLQKTKPETMWRKQYGESCVDNRWTSLRLYMDEMTGKIRIAECRKELYVGGGYQRTCYTSDVIFSDSPDASDPVSTVPLTGLLSYHPSESMTLPNEPILRLRRPDDHPHYFPPIPRLPEDVHSDIPELLPLIYDVPLRHYSTSATTFLDLFNSTTDGRQSLRLRAQSRQRCSPIYPPTHPKAGLLYPLSSDLPMAIKEIYHKRIAEWPPTDHSKSKEDLDAIYKLLNPPNHLGVVNSTADERSVVYMTGSGEKGSPRAIVLISFDPAIKLLGLKGWKYGYGKNRREFTATFKGFNENTSKCSAWLEEEDRYCRRNIVAADQERKTLLLQSIARNRIYNGDKADELAGFYFCNRWHRPRGRYAISSSKRRKLLRALFPGADDADEGCWMSQAQPMYMDIRLGVYLGA